jgi:hypothetical protein
MPLTLMPCSLMESNAYVRENHRNHGEVRGQKFSNSVYLDDKLVGVAIVGRPVARNRDDGRTAEIYRCCTDGTKNACTKLYGGCARAAEGMGYTKIITYTLITEDGASLRAAGFRCIGINKGGEWDRPSRKRKLAEQPCPKKIWLRDLRP